MTMSDLLNILIGVSDEQLHVIGNKGVFLGPKV